MAENEGRQVDCDVNGLFKPLQCTTIDDSVAFQCVCVRPSDGSPLTGTEVVVTDLGDAPDCSAIGTTQDDVIK